MVAVSTVLIIAPDREFRRSLEFALEAEGFSVDSHALLSEAEASPVASRAVCAVVDEGALRIDPAARRSLGRLVKPVILLVEKLSPTGDDDGLTILIKPLHGNALIELVQAFSAL